MVTKIRTAGACPLLAIAIVNKSTVAGVDAAMAKTTAALTKQLAEHWAPTWRGTPPDLAYAGEKTPAAGTATLVLFDDADQAGALGYHDVDPHGVPYGKVFVKTILSNEGTLTDGVNSVSACLSHELLEMIGDQCANVWADGPGHEFAFELCDPVEMDEGYSIDGIGLSNFVLPAWFDPNADASTRFDWLSKLSKPFSMSKDGYMIIRTSSGDVKQVFGERYPEWRKAMKAASLASRASRRKHHPHAHASG